MGQNISLQEAQKKGGGGGKVGKKSQNDSFKRKVGTGSERVSALHAEILDRWSQRKLVIP